MIEKLNDRLLFTDEDKQKSRDNSLLLYNKLNEIIEVINYWQSTGFAPVRKENQ